MRNDITALCVTTWGAVLEFRGWHYNGRSLLMGSSFKAVAHVADPNAIDAGQFIRTDEIKLIIRKKHDRT